MRKLKEVLRLHYECNLSNRKIARALKLSPTTVGHYVGAAQAASLTWSSIGELSEDALQNALTPFCAQLSSPSQSASIDFSYVHQELKKKGVTRELLHEEYVQACPAGQQAMGYSAFCRQYRSFKGKLKPSMRQTHVAGEKLFIDYAGPTVPIIDHETGEAVKAVIFVGVLGASNYTYAEATLTRSLPDWIGSHVRMFNFFGGVSAQLIPDNEKSAVNKACHYDPEVNPHYAALAAHYNTVVMPARPYHPKDKSKAEVGVQVVERWILARLRHQQFFSLKELNTAIASLLEVLNDKSFQKLPGSRRSVFEDIEQLALKPLPAQPYEFAIIKHAQVNLDYHVEIHRHYYSVPYHYINQRIEYHLSESSVSIFSKGERIALHPRSHAVGKATTVSTHMPKAHLAHQEWTPQVFLHFASAVGNAMQAMAKHVIENKPNPEWCYRIHLGFSHLAKKFGETRLNRACEYAIEHQLLSFTHIKSILKTQADQLPTEPANDADLAIKTCQHQNLRGPTYYSTITGDIAS